MVTVNNHSDRLYEYRDPQSMAKSVENNAKSEKAGHFWIYSCSAAAARQRRNTDLSRPYHALKKYLTCHHPQVHLMVCSSAWYEKALFCVSTPGE